MSDTPKGRTDVDIALGYFLGDEEVRVVDGMADLDVVLPPQADTAVAPLAHKSEDP
jgi:hypothetical protein